MNEFFNLLESFFTWFGNNIGLIAFIAFGYWLLGGYVRWYRRFDHFAVKLLRTIAVMKLLNAAGDNPGAVRLYCDLIYSDDLLIFTNGERARIICFGGDLIGCDNGKMAEACNQIADYFGHCYTPFAHLRQCFGEFVKTLFHR